MINEQQNSRIQNPFTVISPEKLNAEVADQLFVEVFSDFPQVRNPGHSMILGARGSGKSMMFRCLLPDVLMLKEKAEFHQLKILAFHVPIKNTQLKITDLQRLDQYHATFLINEHFFSISVMIEILNSLSKMPEKNLPFDEARYRDFFDETYSQLLIRSGCTKEFSYYGDSAAKFFKNLSKNILELHADVIKYILLINPESNTQLPPYNLPFLSFTGFIAPFLLALKNLPGVPDTNIYLFIDDADNLSKTQTKILNSWLSTRTQPEISLKVSAQLGKYKSFVSTNDSIVESPHDYQEVNISDRYTTSKTSYYKRVVEIIEKRFSLSKIVNVSPVEYFPHYEKQEAGVRLEEQKLRKNFAKSGRGSKVSDDVLRYARPNYIKNLGGTRKSRSTYMYAGLEHLVHLSSGVIRYFLDSAASMFDTTEKEKSALQTEKFIPYSIQNQVMREQADKMMFSQFRKLEIDEEYITGNLGIAQKLQNLIFSMGATFHEYLVDETKSERRIFSIALSNIPTMEVKEVLDFGVQTGYLHSATIGNKDGTGRTWLYIMNRLLAPQFILDPTGFAGYLFVTNDALVKAMNLGKALRNISSDDDSQQLSLFD
jgi:hypothetical protein